MPPKTSPKTCKICGNSGTFSKRGNRSTYICDACHSTRHEVVCLACGKVRTLALSTYIEYIAKPWFCSKCAASKRIDNKRRDARCCDKCSKWFIPIRTSTGTCGKCRGLAGPTIKPCEWCGERFSSKKNDARYCSGKCNYRALNNVKYFDGQMKTAIGWETKVCQACDKVAKSYHVHHVFGHPDHSYMVVLHPGCHKAVSEIAWRKYSKETLEKIIAFGLMQRDGSPGGNIKVTISVEPQDGPA